MPGVPVEFLTDEQVARFGCFDEAPSQAELERFFFLDDADRVLVGRHRGEHNRLGFALQLATVRYVGTFLADPLEVPTTVVDFLAAQLEIADPSRVKAYAQRQATQWEHAAEIRRECGYRDFGDASAEVDEFVAVRAWTRVETAKALFDATVAWLRSNRVLLPGASVLARLVAGHRDRATERTHASLHQAAIEADPELPGRLTDLLAVPADSRISERNRRDQCQAMPRKTTRARDRRSMSSSPSRPRRSRRASRRMVVSLSTMRLLSAASPLTSSATTGIRSSGASVGSVVSPHTVTELVASNRSSCTITTGRGLPV